MTASDRIIVTAKSSPISPGAEPIDLSQQSSDKSHLLVRQFQNQKNPPTGGKGKVGDCYGMWWVATLRP